MDFESIIASINANGPMLMLAAAAYMVALMHFALFVGDVLCRFWISRAARGKL